MHELYVAQGETMEGDRVRTGLLGDTGESRTEISKISVSRLLRCQLGLRRNFNQVDQQWA